jgi:hypothetical protein
LAFLAVGGVGKTEEVQRHREYQHEHTGHYPRQIVAVPVVGVVFVFFISVCITAIRFGSGL